MNKSVIIIIVAIWVLCAGYLGLGRVYHFPHLHAAMWGSWVASGLLLICIVMYVRKHKG